MGNTVPVIEKSSETAHGTVIRYMSKGNLALTDAIQSGMLSADVQRMCENVSEENKTMASEITKLRRENAKLRDALTVERRLNKQHIKAQMAGYKAVLDDNSDLKRMRDLRWTLFTAIFSAGALAMMLVTVVIALQ